MLIIAFPDFSQMTGCDRKYLCSRTAESFIDFRQLQGRTDNAE